MPKIVSLEDVTTEGCIWEIKMDLPEYCIDSHYNATNTENYKCAVGDAVEHDRSDSGDYAVECPLAH